MVTTRHSVTGPEASALARERAERKLKVEDSLAVRGDEFVVAEDDDQT